MKRKLRILFDANPLMTSKAGIGQYTARLVEHMAAAYPDDVELIGYYYNFLGRKRPPNTPAGVNIHYRPIICIPGPAVNLLRRFGIQLPIELLTFTKADFVFYPNFLSQPSLFGTPSAAVIHDLMYYEYPQYGSDKNVRDLTRFVPSTLRRSSFIITVSEFSKQRLCEIYQIPADKIVSMFIPPRAPNTLSTDQQQRLLDEQGVDKPYLFFIGTMEPRKNIPALMEAYAALPKELRDIYSLVLAGKLDWKFQETKAKLEQLQSEGHDIRYLGYVDDDTESVLYQRARLVVVASHYEGFGMQISDALGYGTPCAVSDIPVFREVGGDAVAYFDQTSVPSISDTLQTCLEAPAPETTALRAHIASKPNWDTESRRITQLIIKTIKKGRP